MKTLAEKLSARIYKDFDIECKPTIYRTRAGYWQRKRGTFSWFMFLNGLSGEVGSPHRAIEVLKAKKLSLYWESTQGCIYIEEK